jgi:hypothetical protein
MAGLLGKFVAGAAGGLAEGIMAQAEAKKRQALLDLERQYRREDTEYSNALASKRDETEAGRRTAEAVASDTRAREREGEELTEVYNAEDGTTSYKPKKEARGLLSPKSKPDATTAAADPLEDIWDPELKVIKKVPRSKASGLLSAGNKPPRPGEENGPSPADVAGRILDKMARGEKLTADEMKAFEAYQKLDPFRAAMARVLNGDDAAAPGTPDDGLGPKPKANTKPANAVDPDPNDLADFEKASPNTLMEDSRFPGKRFKKVGKWLVPYEGPISPGQ